MIKRILAVLSASFLLCSFSANLVYAEETEAATEHDIIYYQFEDGIPVRQGGVNSIDGVTAETEEETIALEKSLQSQNYILVSSDEKQISDEEFDKFVNGNYNPPYYDFLNKDNQYFWERCKVYVYKPCYDAAMEQLDKKGNVDVLTNGELATSTVLIDYAKWFEKERAGKILDEYNDNIPEWYTETGYLCITTSMTVDVTLELVYEHTFYKFRVTPQKPFLVRLKAGEYNVRVLNQTNVTETEATLPYANTIQVWSECTEENPYLLDLTTTIKTLGVEPLNPDEPFIEGTEEQYTLTEESVEVTNDTDDTNDNKSQRIWTIIFIAVGSAAVLAVIIMIGITKRKYSQE